MVDLNNANSNDPSYQSVGSKHSYATDSDIRHSDQKDSCSDARELLECLFNATTAPIVVFDNKGVLLYANSQFNEFFGFADASKQEWVLFNDQDQAVVHYNSKSIDPPTFKSPACFNGYFTDFNNNNKKSIATFTFSPVYSNSSEYLGFWGILTVGSSIVSTLSIVLCFNLALQELLKSTGQAIVLLDSQRRVISFNSSCWQKYGFNSDVIDVGTDFEQVIRFWGSISKQSGDYIDQAIANLQQNEHFAVEILQNIADNLPLWVNMHHYPFPDGMVVRTYTNISDAKHAELQIKQNEENLLEFFNNLSELLFVIDFNGNIINVSQTVLSQTGYSIDELKHKNVLLLYSDEHKQEALKVFQSMVEGKVDVCTLPLKTKQGTLLEVETRTRTGSWNGKPAIFGVAITRTFEALRESESKYRSLIENSHDGIFIVQNDCFVFVNDALCQMLDIQRDELEGMFFTNILAPELRQYALEQHQKRIGGHKVFNRFDASLVNPKNHKRIECKMSVGQIIFNGLPATMGTIHDMTEEVLAQAKIKRNEQFLQAVLSLSPLGISVRSNTGKLLLYNPAWQKIWAIPTESIIKDMTTERESFRLDYRDNYASEWWEDIARIYSQGGSLVIPEMRLLGLREGSAKWVSQYFYAINNDDGKVDRVVIITQDITTRMLNELALKESQEHYSILLDAVGKSGVGLAMVKIEENSPIVIFANNALYKLLEYPPNELIGMSIYNLIKVDHISMVKDRVALWQSGINVPDVIEAEVVTKFGRVIPVEALPKPTVFNNHEVTVTLVRDISERKTLEEERIKLSKLESLGVLAGGIAHDFNNLLTSILGYTNLMQLDAPDIYTDYLDNIELAIQQASRLTQQLLTFAKGGHPVKKLSKIEEIIRRETEFALLGSSITYNISSNNPWLANIDQGQIAQVIHNVVINAKQSMPQGGNIDINIANIQADKQKFLAISVTDHGVGIRKEHIAKIFDPYFSTKPTGSGLGLAICHSIIVKHNGKITVKSVPGVGTTFNIWLPASDTSDIEHKEINSSDANLDLSNLRVLVMDDEPTIRDFLVKSLERYNCIVTACKNGEEAISIYSQSILKQNVFDIVILDLTIPGSMGGVETIQKLLEIDPGVQAIAASGYSTDPAVSNYEEYGFKNAVAKPFNIQSLIRTILAVTAES